MRVEVVYALPERQYHAEVELAEGATVADAVARARDVLPQFDMTKISLGIFGKLASADTPLRQGDRIEIYRPLQVDPMQARRLRARKKASLSKLR